MQGIPLTAVPAQSFAVVLNGQNCGINVYQKSTGMLLDLLVNGVPVITCVLCRDRVKLIRQAYLGFVGDLSFVDTEEADDPQYQGLGNRWLLMYLEETDL